MQIFCSLPVTTATSERSFSTMNRIKIKFRSVMGEERITGLALLSLHRDFKIDFDASIDAFALLPRRLKFGFDKIVN